MKSLSLRWVTLLFILFSASTFGGCVAMPMGIITDGTVGARTTTRSKGFEPAPEGFTETGKASWYGADFDGKPTSSGEIFDMNKMTAAHKTLPFGTMVVVTDPKTSKTVKVKINDRGPFVGGRIIDLSHGAAKALGVENRGVFDVSIATVAADTRAALPDAPVTQPVKRDALGRVIAEGEKNVPANSGDAPPDPIPPTENSP